MKTAFFALGLAVVAASVNAIDYEVASCAELADIDDTTVTSLTITSTPFECDSYTRFRVRNDMVLKSDSAVELSNFALKVLGNLTVEPDVTFQNVTEQETHGGALYVHRGSSATFIGTASFIENSVISTEVPSTGSYKRRHGGAVYNKGELVFEGAVEIALNEARTRDSTDLARGGAIYNHGKGTITFNGPLTASENYAQGFFSGQGGAIFNAGEVVVNGTSSFTDNQAADGGAVYNDETGTTTFNDFANFTENRCSELKGGAIASYGLLNMVGGSLFQSNYASSSGDGGSGGAIYNGEDASLSFGGDNTFDDNWAFKGGAIYNEAGGSISPLQDGGELIFQNIRGEICPGIYYEMFDDVDPVCGV